jgi:hypothetical protein
MLDEMKIIESGDSKSFSNPSTNRNLQLEIVRPYSREPNFHRETQPDIVWIFNLDPTARFLRGPYINTSTSNDSLLILRAQTHSPLVLPFQVLV